MIDWQKQWKAFAPNFHEGMAHIDLNPHGILKLLPGGGFGDFSHPTTRLTLHAMRSKVQNKVILDIGCGSGILSLAAVMMGAQKACGIDIEDEAIEHSKKNALLNQLQHKTEFAKTLQSQPNLILMNMISSEQLIAWDMCLPKVEIITSGVLAEQRDDYLTWTSSLGWKLKEEYSEEGWLCFYFN